MLDLIIGILAVAFITLLWYFADTSTGDADDDNDYNHEQGFVREEKRE